MTTAANVADSLDRPVPRLGGFSPTILRLEVRRLMRNRRTMIIALVMPVILFWAFGLNTTYVNLRVGHGNESAVVMISMALYGAVFATASGGAMVSVERATGWSRQLRVTPLSPVAYIAIKMLTALVLGGASVAAVYTVGALTRNPSMPTHLWVITGLAVWIGSLLFAAFGLFLGYVVPAENVAQILGITLSLCSFGGGLFIPLNQFSPAWRTTASLTPLYGLSQLVHYPLAGGNFAWGWILSIAVWLAVFAGGAVWLLRRDTSRV